MEPPTLLAAGLVCVVVLVACHQWLLDSPLFELGTAAWFPTGSDLRAVTAVARSALAALVPLVATLVAAGFVFLAPFDAWVWAVVALLAATVALSPVLAVYRYDVRPPTPAEERALAAVPDLGCEVLVVADARDGPVNGYAIGGPFRDVVGVSAFALARLPVDQVAALVAHEATHHRERHVLVRGGASVVVLAGGAAVATALFDALVPAAALCLLATLAVERTVAHWVMRRGEYRADAVAARETSAAAVLALLETLDDAAGVDQVHVPRLLRLFSTHPTYADRVARLRALAADGSGGSRSHGDANSGDGEASGAGQTPDSATPR